MTVLLRRLTLAATAAAVAGGGLVALAAPGTPSALPMHRVALHATTTTTTPAHPATNIPPSPDYWPICATSGATSATCITAEVTAIDNARAVEGVGPMSLPTGFASMSPAEQTFVVSNLERVDRGLTPAAGMVDTLNAVSTTAAQNDADPSLSSWTVGPFNANRWGSIWAGDLNALAADYDWMYNDGWSASGSYNLDCTSATAAGCWGHRDNILSPYGGEQLITGVGSVKQSQWTSIAQIFVAGVGSYPSFTLAWSDITGAAGTTPPPVASGNAVTPTSDATQATVTAPATVVAGRSGVVSGRLVDTTTGLGVPAASVSLCRRPTTGSSTTCAAGTTDSDGRVTFVVRPTTATAYWLTYQGTATLAAAASNTVTVHVRPALNLARSRTSTGWRITARLTPAHAQVVRLQRQTSRGWVTVAKRTASSTFAFSRLRSGSYRVVVAGATGLSGVTTGIRCA